jgi:hypothetical protein
VASESLPSDLTLVPVPAEVAPASPASPSPAAGAVPSFTDLTSSGMSPITSGLIAVAVATLVVWVGGKLRRRP